MSATNSPDALGNILRLQGLKNVSGRSKKRIRGAPYLFDEETELPEIKGVANELPPANTPQLETGTELSPQSYDIRSNEVIEPPVHEPGSNGILARLGKSLSKEVFPRWRNRNAPPIETQQVEESEGLPPVNPEMQEVQIPQENAFQKIGGALKDYVRPFLNPEKREEATAKNVESLRNAQNRIQESNAGISREQSEAEHTANQEIDQEQLNKAQENPLDYVVYGATDVFANHPELTENYREITGEDFNPQDIPMIKPYEQVLADIQNNVNPEGYGYDEQARRINERILSNSATDMDKYYIGLALLMPLLVGGLFGHEAGIGTLGATGEALAKGYGNRQEQIRKDEALLADINQVRGKTTNAQNERDMILEPYTPRTLINEKTGKKIEGREILPGLVINEKYLTTDKGIERKEKAAKELSERRAIVDSFSDTSEDILDIVSQLKDKKGAYKYFVASLRGKVPPGYLSKLGDEEVYFEGRKQKAGPLLENKIGIWKTDYAQEKKLGQLDKAATTHLDTVIANPSSTLSSPQDSINQVLSVMQGSQKNYLNRVKNEGFIPEFAAQDFKRRNERAHGKLNYKESLKESKENLKEKELNGR